MPENFTKVGEEGEKGEGRLTLRESKFERVRTREGEGEISKQHASLNY